MNDADVQRRSMCRDNWGRRAEQYTGFNMFWLWDATNTDFNQAAGEYLSRSRKSAPANTRQTWDFEVHAEYIAYCSEVRVGIIIMPRLRDPRECRWSRDSNPDDLNLSRDLRFRRRRDGDLEKEEAEIKVPWINERSWKTTMIESSWEYQRSWLNSMNRECSWINSRHLSLTKQPYKIGFAFSDLFSFLIDPN